MSKKTSAGRHKSKRAQSHRARSKNAQPKSAQQHDQTPEQEGESREDAPSAVTQITSLRNFPYIHLLAGVAICFAVYEIILGKVDPDEVEAFHTAWKLFTGESIYRDFFQHHNPLFYYLLVPVVAIGGEAIFTFYLAEFFSAVLWAGIVVTTYQLARKIYGDQRIALLSIVLLLVFPWFIIRGTHIRPDIPQVLLGLLSFYYLVLALDGRPENGSERRKRRHLLLSALMLSLSFLALQKAIFLIFVMGLILLYRLFFASSDVRMTVKDFLLYWAVFSLLPMLYVLYLFMVGAFWDYFDFNWLINMRFIENFSVLSRVMGDMNVLVSMTGFTALFIAGCFVRPEGNAGAHWAAVLAGICLMASLFFTRTPHPQYYLMAMPFVSIIAAASLRHFLPPVVTGLILSVLLFLCGNHLIEGTKDGTAKKEALSTMRHVLEVSEPNDVYFGYRKTNLFRKHADFFWFCFTPGKCLDTYRSFREYDWNPLQIITQTRPKVIGPRWEGAYAEVVWWDSLMKHPAVAPYYERSPGHPSVYTRKEMSSK